VTTTDPFRDWDAAYVLGGLSGEQRRAFERHIAECPACAAAVAELAGMPGILGRLPVEEALTLAPAFEDDTVRGRSHEPGIVQRLAAAATASRRRARRRATVALAALAAALLAGGIVLGTFLSPGPDVAGPAPTSAPAVSVIRMQPVGDATMTADLSVTRKAWGTRLDWSCHYGDGPWDSRYQPSYDLVVTDASGAESVVASWRATGPRAGGLAASSSVPTREIRSIEIRSGNSDAPLVRAEL
jgi:Putative zinc-finger